MIRWKPAWCWRSSPTWAPGICRIWCWSRRRGHSCSPIVLTPTTYSSLSSDRRWRGLCRACCTGGPGRDRCPCLSGVDAAREENSSAAVRPSSSASTTICLFLIMCMSLIPTRVSWAVLSRKWSVMWRGFELVKPREILSHMSVAESRTSVSSPQKPRRFP